MLQNCDMRADSTTPSPPKKSSRTTMIIIMPTRAPYCEATRLRIRQFLQIVDIDGAEVYRMGKGDNIAAPKQTCSNKITRSRINVVMCIVGDRLRHCVLFPFSRKHEATLRRAGLKETYAIVQSDEQALSGMYKQTKEGWFCGR